METINQRPGIEIITPSVAPHRGDQDVEFQVVFEDPEGHGIFPHWTVRACDDGNRPETCDMEPIATGEETILDVDVPKYRADGVTPVRSLRVRLSAEDEYGAIAKPPQLAVTQVLDAEPDVIALIDRPYDGVVDTPVDLFLEYGDADDTAAGVTIEIEVTAPGLADETLTEIADVEQPSDATRARIGRRLVPEITGEWRFDITATSPGGEVVTSVERVTIIEDRPPCLEELAPAVPPPDALLPLAEPTLFQVLYVSDALDRFPTIVGDPLLGPTRFAWSLKVGSAPRALLGSASNAIELDPKSFTPGELVELRVEVFDRTETEVTCADEDPSCTVVNDPTCTQRQTWRLEVR